MSKPLGYYTNYTPGDGGLLGDMEESWGSQLQELNNSEQLWILFCVVGTMASDESEYYDPSAVDEHVELATERLNELSFRDQLGLAEALINQIRANSH